MQRNNGNKKNKNGKSIRSGRKARNPDNSLMRNSIPLVMPKEWLCKMRYSTDFALDSAAATFQYSYRLLTGIYDPDDGGSSNERNYTGFNNIAPLYESYQVQKVKYKLEIVNNSTQTITFVTCPSSRNLSTQYTLDGALIQNFCEQPDGRKEILAPVSGLNRAVIAGTYSMITVAGGRAIYDNPQFRGFYNANPSVPFYQFFGIFADANLTVGVTVSLTYTAHILFSTRRFPLDQETIAP